MRGRALEGEMRVKGWDKGCWCWVHWCGWGGELGLGLGTNVGRVDEGEFVSGFPLLLWVTDEETGQNISNNNGLCINGHN